MRILLTGIHGQVGRELRLPLACIGEVIETAAPGEEGLCFDLAKPEVIRAVIREVKPDLIVNPAAYTAVDQAESDRDLAERVNHQAPAVMAEEMKRLGGGMIHFSTDYVYSGEGSSSFTESSEIAACNWYGETKAKGDQAVLETLEAAIILRTSWVFSEHGRNFVKTVLRLAKERPDLGMIADQIGSPTSARTLADVTSQILAAGQGDWLAMMTKKRGVTHVVNRGYTSWFGFAEEILKVAASFGIVTNCQLRPIKTTDYPTPAKRPLNSRLSLERLTEVFGLQTPTWQQALKRSFPLIAS